MAILNDKFFNRKTLIVARELLGKYIVRKQGKTTVAYRITEVEAYVGVHDLACHSAKGRTKRTEVMFGPAGRFYLYFVYGMHWMLNIVTESKNQPSAILIRGLEEVSGPGRVTKTLKLDGRFNGKSAKTTTGLWFEDRGELKPKVICTPRIGVAYAGPIWSAKPYRFIIKTENKKLNF